MIRPQARPARPSPPTTLDGYRTRPRDSVERGSVALAGEVRIRVGRVVLCALEAVVADQRAQAGNGGARLAKRGPRLARRSVAVALAAARLRVGGAALARG